MKTLLAILFACAWTPSGSAQDIMDPAFVASTEVEPTGGGGGGDITDSLRGWYKFDDGSGTTAANSSGSGANGTLTGATLPTWVSGHISGALDFGNVVSTVSLGANYLGTGDKTISMWINLDNLPASVANLAGETQCAFWLDSGGTLKFTSDGTGTTVAGDLGDISSGSWFFVAVSVTSAGVANIYVDGVLSGSANQASGTVSTSPFDMSIGANPVGFGAPDGKVDDVRFYNRILSAAEILQIHDLTP